MASRGRRDFSIDDAFEESEEDRVSYYMTDNTDLSFNFLIEVMRIRNFKFFPDLGSPSHISESLVTIFWATKC
jgi:hypothetical protein